MTHDNEEPSADLWACPHITGTVTRYCTLTPFTLTDEEREAIGEAVQAFDEFAGDEVYTAALRGLLERTK